jgi:hypothetical protein
MKLWLFLAWWAFFTLLTRGHFQATEEIAVYQEARSLWEQGRLDISPMINSSRGPDGRWYASYGIGQSLLAAPLYGAGKLLHGLLADRNDWVRTFSGPISGDEAVRWAGDFEIFVVALFCPFVTALLCAQFFVFSLELGANLNASLLSTVLLGTSSYIAGFSSTFLPHSLEALILLRTFYLCFADAALPSPWRRIGVGAWLGFGIIVRAQMLVLLPAVAAYLLWNSWQRHRTSGRRVMGLIRECAPFAILAAGGVATNAFVHYLKTGGVSFAGTYSQEDFSQPVLVSLYGFIVSPGKSVFLFTPLLMMAHIYWRPFVRQQRAMSWCIVAASCSYLAFFSVSHAWHGAWFLGPRYLAALVPLLLLPFAMWWKSAASVSKGIALAWGALGVFIQMLHVSINFSFVWFAEQYQNSRPDTAYLFIPSASPLAAYYRAFIAGDSRLDMWLVNVYRMFGMSRLLIAAAPLVLLLALSIWRVATAIGNAPQPALEPPADSHESPVRPGFRLPVTDETGR